MDQLCGYIERITFQNSETGFTVAQLKAPNRHELICIVGIMPALQPGETITASGAWKSHLLHGKQFQVNDYKITVPSDIEGIKKYLGSGLISGIGPAYAKRIVDTFGTETLNIMEATPERLEEVQGIGPKRIEQIKACWNAQRSIRDVMVFLQTYGVSPAFAQKIFKTYGDKSIAIVKENPYQLARDIFGIGFKTADTIARKIGISSDDPGRLDAGIEFVLRQFAEEGHVCYPYDELIIAAGEILEASTDLISPRLAELKQQNYIEIADLLYEGNMRSFVWLKMYFHSEMGIGKDIRRLLRHSSYLRNIDIPKALEWVQVKLEITLAAYQKKAVAMALEEKAVIITGGPGTGKSTITKAILAIMEKLTGKILLAAPTGRAAKRMTEITGRKASTIHSLLEYDFKSGFKRKMGNPLDCDLLIVDETSMIDTSLMFALLRAVPEHSKLILVGDINQLPSVGPGNVLKDLINSRCLPVTMLNEIFRQAAGSRIITNAHRINNGVFPEVDNSPGSDFFFIDAQEPQDVLNNIISLVSQRLPKKYGFHPIHDIQVLTPMKKALVGSENLNTVLQEALNNKKETLVQGGRKYGVGDKVIQLRNDYNREVFNGDIGIITQIDSGEQQLTVNVDGREILYEYADLDELALAYAISIHKYQGSECPCVVIPVHTTHFKLLMRNLLYTGVTRGRKLVVLVGTKKALAIAVKNDEAKRRHTGLMQAMLEQNTQQLPLARK